MDNKTDNMIEVSIEDLADLYGTKSSCRKCNGRGYIGKDKYGLKILCSCLKKRIDKEGDKLSHTNIADRYLLEAK